MFGMIRTIVKIIIGSPQRKPEFLHQSMDSQPQPVRKEPSLTYTILFIGGLVILLSGMVHGSVFGAFFHDDLVSERNDQLRYAITYASMAQEEEAEKCLKSMEETDKIISSVKGAHSHLSLFGLIALAIASNIHRIRLKDYWKFTAAIVFLAGGVLLPIGVNIQPFVNEALGKYTAIIGGTMILASITIFLWGAARDVWIRRYKKV